ncbi:MAG TPA: XRE family transcriptional regulator [Thermotogota bacterium]|nr:XRE family transcriptional regulator [Thermotogota bacterium]HRW92912.1 XRE family transcriptional regulator [Thermotogota bacterium]
MTPGEKIRKLRLAKGLTQEDVAARADLARSFISQVETGKTSPTLDNLERILKAVGSGLKDFFSDAQQEMVVYKREERIPVYDEPKGIRSEMLMDEVESKKIDAFLVTLEPRAQTEEEDYHEGDEFGFVLDGQAQLVLDGKPFSVRKGDCFYYRADKKHFLENNSTKRKCMILWIKID